MSVYIKGLEMPKWCAVCIYLARGCRTDGHDSKNIFEPNIPMDCPLVEVPKHGRLIDADELKPDMYDERLAPINGGKGAYYVNMKQIENAPTILEAEE